MGALLDEMLEDARGDIAKAGRVVPFALIRVPSGERIAVAVVGQGQNLGPALAGVVRAHVLRAHGVPVDVGVAWEVRVRPVAERRKLGTGQDAIMAAALSAHGPPEVAMQTFRIGELGPVFGPVERMGNPAELPVGLGAVQSLLTRGGAS